MQKNLEELKQNQEEIPQGKTLIRAGDKFNLLTVLFRAKSKNNTTTHTNGYAYFACKCDCGNFTIAKGAEMKFKRPIFYYKRR